MKLLRPDVEGRVFDQENTIEMAPIDGDKEGYWGKPTATLDWCEENYAVTPYIAEFCK